MNCLLLEGQGESLPTKVVLLSKIIDAMVAGFELRDEYIEAEGRLKCEVE